MTEQLDLAATQKTASRVAARAEILDVRLVKSNFEIFVPPARGSQLSFAVELKPGVEYAEGDDALLVSVDYKVDIESIEPDQSGESTPVASVTFKFLLFASIAMRDGDAAIAESEVQAYANTTGTFALYPYAREYLQSVTTRMGLPPLTLSVLQMPSSGPSPAPNSAKKPVDSATKPVKARKKLPKAAIES